jgi:guanylate kinase
MKGKNEILIICGKSGSGKDWTSNKLTDFGIKRSIKTTTRPKRLGEKNNIDYRFVKNGEFNYLDRNDGFLVKEKFYNHLGEEWNYGVLKEDLKKGTSIIMTPGEIKQICEEDRKKFFVVYLDIDRNIRKERITKRKSQEDSVKRRLDSDEEDFKNFTDYDLKLNEINDDILDLINSLMS